MAKNNSKPIVDSIHKTPELLTDQPAKSEQPLISILEPEKAKPEKLPTQEKKIEPEKKNFLFRDLFETKQKPKVPTEKPARKPIIKPHHKKIALALTIFGVLASVVILIAGGAYAHQEIYTNKVYPGVVVWGEDVGGKTMTEVQKLVTKKIKNYKIKLTGPDQIYTATANDLGLVFDSETMALSAYSKGRTGSFWNNYVTRARLMGARINWKPLQSFFRADELVIKPSYRTNEKKLDEYINKISTNINIPAKDSEVKIVNGNTNLIPAVYGREVIKEKLKNNLKNNLASFGTGEIKIETKQTKPAIIDNSAQEVMVQAQSVMSRPVILTYKGQTFKPDKETVASWITFVKPAGSTKYTLVVDSGRMYSYFDYLGTKLNIYPINRKVQIENGAKETVLQEGKDGLLVDEITLGQSIAMMLPNQPTVNLPIPMYVAKFKTEFNNILIADWDKYIEINLSTQTLTAYLKGGQLVGSWKVTTGNNYHPTPAGTWLVHGKSAITRMTGGTPGVDYYDLPNVHWVTWFKGGGYSIHEAYWRSSFGGMDYVWNGSHGCVNATLSLAKFIYDWAPIGTPVIVHY